MAERWAEGVPAPVVPLVPLDPVPLSFAAFYREELPRLVALAAAIAGTRDAEDIAQEALLRAHRDWGRVGRLDKPGAWVRRVAINLTTSRRRRQGAEARALTRASTRRALDVPPPEVEEFWRLVRQLPPRQAAAVALHYLEDLSIQQMAEALGCAEGTAKAHLHKARQTLARRLAEEPER